MTNQLQNRVNEMRDKRIHPQETANSIQMTAKLADVQAADNYKNLSEAPTLFYALCATAMATGYVPDWLVVCAWIFVALRYLHSFIHCTYNKVMHRFPVFLTGLTLLTGSWIAFAIAYLNHTAT